MNTRANGFYPVDSELASKYMAGDFMLHERDGSFVASAHSRVSTHTYMRAKTIASHGFARSRESSRIFSSPGLLTMAGKLSGSSVHCSDSARKMCPPFVDKAGFHSVNCRAYFHGERLPSLRQANVHEAQTRLAKTKGRRHSLTHSTHSPARPGKKN